ncbi:MAG: hypothetical protein ABR570_11155 [Burkholderiales bacterium]
MSAIPGRSPNCIALLGVCAALAGCTGSGRWDPHAPRTVTASEQGGQVVVQHGDRLRLPLASDPAGAYEWRLVEPPVRMVVAEGPPGEQGINLTPVRTGEEQLRLEYRPVASEGPAQRSVSYDVTVLEQSGVLARIRSLFTRKRS